MNRFDGVRPSVGKVVASCILAMILGAVQPLAVIFQMILPAPGISLAMIASAAFYGSAGVVPVIVLGVTSMLSCLLMFGLPTGIVSMLLWLIPAIVIILGMRKGGVFFKQLTKGIAAAVAATVLAAVCMVALNGPDVIEMFVDQMRRNFTSQQELFYQTLSAMFSAEMTLEQFAEMYYTSFNTLQVYYQYYLIANLLCGAIASACIAVLWGNWKIAKRGMATAESYRGLSQWYLPANTTWGLLLMLAAGFITSKIGADALQTVWIVVESLCQLAFVIQFLGALNRRMQNGSSYAARTIMIALLLMMGYSTGLIEIMAILGGVSALFGSKGAAKALIDKFKNNTDGENR